MRKSNVSVIMKAVTWNKDSHGLFDYESRHVRKRQLKSNTTGKLVRNGEEIQIMNDPIQLKKILASAKNEDDVRLLASLIQHDNCYSIQMVNDYESNYCEKL